MGWAFPEVDVKLDVKIREGVLGMIFQGHGIVAYPVRHLLEILK